MRRIAAVGTLAVLAWALLARRRQRRAVTPLPAQPGPEPESLAAPAPDAPFASVAWTLATPPGKRSELAIRCHQDDALVLDRVEVQETPTQVFLTAIARREPLGPGEPPREHAHATVALSRPLGERELIPTPVDAGPAPSAGPGAPPVYP